jgi:enoyl-[acyl-carrier protein] reductase I
MVIPTAKAALLEGKKGLIVGIANERSIAWGCAKAFHALGAELAITYVNDKTRKYVEPLAREAAASLFMPLNVQTPGQIEEVFKRIAKDWGRMDFLVHSLASALKETLRGRVVDASREGFLTTMNVSCWSFIRMAQLAEPLMKKGVLFTMTYYGSQMVVEHYNIMGLSRRGTRSERYSRSCHLTRATSDPCGIRYPGDRQVARKGAHQGAGAQPRQH